MPYQSDRSRSHGFLRKAISTLKEVAQCLGLLATAALAAFAGRALRPFIRLLGARRRFVRRVAWGLAPAMLLALFGGYYVLAHNLPGDAAPDSNALGNLFQLSARHNTEAGIQVAYGRLPSKSYREEDADLPQNLHDDADNHEADTLPRPRFKPEISSLQKRRLIMRTLPRTGISRTCLPRSIKAKLAAIERNFGRVRIISSFRRGARIAGTGKRSYHASCRAVDFHPPRGRYRAVLSWLRRNHGGGLGTYSCGMHHIHIDSGPRVRFHHCVSKRGRPRKYARSRRSNTTRATY